VKYNSKTYGAAQNKLSLSTYMENELFVHNDPCC